MKKAIILLMVSALAILGVKYYYGAIMASTLPDWIKYMLLH